MHISNRCSVAVHCLIYINEFSGVKKVTSELLSASTGCNPVTIRSIMSALKKDGMISIRPGTGGTWLECSPEEISLYRICMAVEPDAIQKLMGIQSCPDSSCQVGSCIKDVLSNAYRPLQDDLAEAMKKITMQDFLREYHAVQAGQPV